MANDKIGDALFFALLLAAASEPGTESPIERAHVYREKALPRAKAADLIKVWGGLDVCKFSGLLAIATMLHEYIPLVLHQAENHKSPGAAAWCYGALALLGEAVHQNERALQAGFDAGYNLPSSDALKGLAEKLATFESNPREEAQRLRTDLERVCEQRDDARRELTAQRGRNDDVVAELERAQRETREARRLAERTEETNEHLRNELQAANGTIAAMQRQAIEKLEHIVIRDDSNARVLSLVGAELQRAQLKHQPFESPHKAQNVLQQTVDELWDVNLMLRDAPAAIRQAIRVSAMGARFVIDMCAKYRGTAELPQVDDLALPLADIQTPEGRVGDMGGALDSSVEG